MSGDDYRSMQRVLAIVTGVVALAFVGLLLVAFSEDPPAGLMGLAGAVVGAIVATYYHVAVRRSGAVGQADQEAIGEIALRLRELELSQGRVLELEERVDFAERLLARGQAEHVEGRNP